MLLAECWLQNKRYYFPFYGFEFIERLCTHLRYNFSTQILVYLCFFQDPTTWKKGEKTK